MIRKAFCIFVIFIAAGLIGGSVLAQNEEDVDAVDEAEATVDDERDEDIDSIVVTGVRSSLQRAVELKRNSMEIVDSIVAEDLGKFPDNNVVEAMQRIPGIQVTNRGAGEVSSLSIRGLSSTTTTINGRNMFTASGRQVALQDIPATLVRRVEVYKTRSPDQISRGLAGQVNIRTHRPFDFDEFTLLGQARATYQEQAEEVDPNLSFLVSNVWSTDAGDFGALINASYAKTNWLDQGVHAGASVLFRPPDDPVAPLERLFPPLWTPGLEQGMPTEPGSTLPDGTPYVHSRDAVFQPHVRGERERPAVNLALQWAPDERSEYTFEAFYTGFRNTQHNALFFTFVDWWGAVDPNDPVEFHPDTNVIKSRFVNFPYQFISADVLEQDTDSFLYALGGEWDVSNNLVVKSELVYQDSRFKDQFFALRMDKVSPRLFVDFNPGDGVPFLEFFDNPDTPQDESDLTDPDQWNLAELYDNGQRNQGDAFTWTADAEQALDWGWVNALGFGARYDERGANERGRTQGGNHCLASPACAGLGGTDFPGLMGSVTGHFDGRAGVTAWAIPTQSGLLENREALREAYGLIQGPDLVLNDEFSIEETKYEFYLQADFSKELPNGFLDGRFGVRYVDQETDMEFPDPATGGIARATNSNDTLLPSLMVRWGITPELMARFAYTEVFELPSFPQLSPAITLFPDVTEIGFGTAAGGNPDLKPIKSENTDLSLEWYFEEGSVLYATWFKRDIRDNIVPFRNAVLLVDPNDPDAGATTFILSQPDNAGESKLDGWEFGLTWFPELTGWFDGFGFQGSYTILDSNQEVPVTNLEGEVVGFDEKPLFGVSDSSYSAILAYDREAFSARLSYFWREKFLDRNEAALFANPLGIYKSPEKSLDFQATWHVDDRWTLTFDATNLTEEIYQENYGDNPVIFNHLNNLFSRTFSLGVRFRL